MIASWVPIVLFAAVAQTARNAAQRAVVAEAGVLGATLARFLYGIPLAFTLVVAIQAANPHVAPAFLLSPRYFACVFLGAIANLTATALLLTTMRWKNFAVGVTYSKTDALQVAILGTVFLGEYPGGVGTAAIGVATMGVVLLSSGARLPKGVDSARPALCGLASGAAFALSSLAYRTAVLGVGTVSPWVIGAWGVFLAQTIQGGVLGGYLLCTSPLTFAAIARSWRVSIVAGAAGALASVGWFTALAMTTAANVRALGMLEVAFSVIVSHTLLRERISAPERCGVLLLSLGVVGLLARA